MDNAFHVGLQPLLRNQSVSNFRKDRNYVGDIRDFYMSFYRTNVQMLVNTACGNSRRSVATLQVQPYLGDNLRDEVLVSGTHLCVHSH